MGSRPRSSSTGYVNSPSNSHRSPSPVPNSPPATTASPSEIHAIGPFILGKSLGEGATGKVKLAFHRDTGFKVAVKIIKKDMLLSKPQLHKKVEKEIAILKLIDHPNVLKLYDVYETSRYLFLVLDYVEGGELFDFLLQRGSLEPGEALYFFQMLIHGVDYCHSRHICHRDLKPENLLLDLSKRLKLGDFGMAAILRQGQLLSTSCGSPHYASPEVVMGVHYDGKPADIWSCGGKLPFDDDNIRALLRKVKEGIFAMPQYLPRDIKDLISRMLTVNPAKRITVIEIKNHTWFTSNSYHVQFPLCTVLEDTSSSIRFSEIDADLFATLESLGLGSKHDLQVQLTSPEPNQLRAFYRILQYNKDHPPSNAYERDALTIQRMRTRGRSSSSVDEDFFKKRGAFRERSNSSNSRNIMHLPRVGHAQTPEIPSSPKSDGHVSLPHLHVTIPPSPTEEPELSPGDILISPVGSPSTRRSNRSASPRISQEFSPRKSREDFSPPASPLHNIRNPRSSTPPIRATSPSPSRNSGHTSPLPIRFQRMNLTSSVDEPPSSPVVGTSPARKSFWANLFTANKAKQIDFAFQTMRPIDEVHSELQRCMESLAVEWNLTSETSYKCRYSSIDSMPSVHFTIEISRLKTTSGNTPFFVDFHYYSGDGPLYNDMCSVLESQISL